MTSACSSGLISDDVSLEGTTMPRLRVHNLSISVDGYTAGPDRDLEHPLGVGGERLHEWVFATRTGRRVIGESGGESGTDDRFLARGEAGIGATIMGRNTFGPVRGPWPDEEGTGWWGSGPPYHHPVFVLTSHPRPPLTMAGGTTSTFVTGGIHAAQEQACEAAGEADVRLGGGAATVQQYLRAALVDELHVVVVPVPLGAGERLLAALDGGPAGLECVGFTSSAAVAHVRFARGAHRG
jgi:dihydrofolate reductase